MSPLIEVLLIMGCVLGFVGLFFGTMFVCVNHFVPWYKVTDVTYNEDRYDKVHVEMTNPRLGHIARGEDDTYWQARIKAQDKLYVMGRRDKQRLQVERKAAKLKGEPVPSILHPARPRKRALRKISKGQF